MTEETSNTAPAVTPTFNPSDTDALVAFLEKAPGPVDLDTLAAGVGAQDGEREALESSLSSLAGRGSIIETRDGRFGSPTRMNLVVGRLTCHEKGFGFVIPRDPSQEDLYIPRRKLGDALHGDQVVARCESTRRHRTEGRIIRVLERARTQVVGKFEPGTRFGYVVPLDTRIGYEVYVAAADTGEAKPGQLVTAEITKYPEGKGRRSPEGRIVEVLGELEDPKLDVEVIIREFGLPHEFPAEVLAEADQMGTEITEEDIEGREDFRALPIVTIDGENAKDFDDAIHVEKLSNGNFKLAVHIADVSAYVPVGSAIDQEAQLRATSVYFPDRVVPMLPEKLSNELCSLKPGVDRLVQSVIIEIDSNGRTVNYELYDGVIRSAERMTYNTVAALLDGTDEELAKKYADHVDHFKLMSELCDVLRKYRARRGSIDFDLPEPQMRINMLGEVEDIFRSERNQAHRLIEEFMIRCNEVVASHTVWEDVDSVYRVHEGPDAEKVEQFREFIGGLGLHLGGGKKTSSADFQRLVEHLEGQPGERTIIYLMLRSMKQARYQPENNGHFGLASPRYTHFTSPIRRYPDLIVHRLMKVDREATTQEAFDVEAFRGRLDALSTDCSERERTAEGAERRYVDWKTVQFMADKQGDSFEAFITGVHAYGFFVELEGFFVEGLVHISSLDDDYYQYEERKHTLRGQTSGRTLTLGNRVKVQLARVDKDRRRLDFQLEEGPLETGITPLAKAEKAEKRDDDGKGRRRKRRRRGRKGGEAAKGGDAAEGGQAAEAADRGEKSGSGDDKTAKSRDDKSADEKSGRRRRRGTRGRGRGRSAAEGGEDSSDTAAKRTRRRSSSAKSKDEEAGSDRGKSRAASGRSGGRRTEGKKTASRSRSEGKDASSSRSEGRGSSRTRTESKDASRSGSAGKDASRSGSGGRRSSSRPEADRATAAGSAPGKDTSGSPAEGAQPPKDKPRPKVNPYLTDL